MKDINVSAMTVSERILYDGDTELEDVQLDQDSLGETTSTGGRSKHQSMDFSGSVFLIASNGHVLSLPIPSESPDDPLNWVKTRRALVFVILLLYGSVALFTVQAPGVLYTSLIQEFSTAVCHLMYFLHVVRTEMRATNIDVPLQDMKPFTIDILASSPTLALGLSFFLWMPLGVGFGRRATLVFASAILTSATLVAGFTHGFRQILAALCLMGVATGVSISTVGFINHPHPVQGFG